MDRYVNAQFSPPAATTERVSPSASANASMCKIWIVKLKVGVSTTDAAFTSTFRKLLEYCYSYSGTNDGHHSLWQDFENPNLLVMITGYPTFGSNLLADKHLPAELKAGMFQFIEHVKLFKLDRSVLSLPLDAKVLKLALHVSGSVPGRDSESEHRVTVREIKGAAEPVKDWVLDISSGTNTDDSNPPPKGVPSAEATQIDLTLAKVSG